MCDHFPARFRRGMLLRMHCVGYQIDKDGGAFLKRLTEPYKGQFRLVRKRR
jgi:hypothetical protein